jgi:hypothetical protein
MKILAHERSRQSSVGTFGRNCHTFAVVDPFFAVSSHALAVCGVLSLLYVVVSDLQ